MVSKNAAVTQNLVIKLFAIEPHRFARAVEEQLLTWILLAVALGVLFPGLTAITRFSTLILALMVGSVSLTITLGDVRNVSRLGLASSLAGHLLMPIPQRARPVPERLPHAQDGRR